MELGLTRDVHRSLMSALHRTGATATELLNTAASLRWDAAWKSSVSGPDKERRRLDETWWDAYKPSVTVPPRSHRGGIGFPARGICRVGQVGEGLGRGSWDKSDISAWWCDKSSHDCFQSFLNLKYLFPENLKHMSILPRTILCIVAPSISVSALYIITRIRAGKLCIRAREPCAWPSAPAVIPSELSHWAAALLHHIPLILKLHMKPDNKPQSLIYLPKRDRRRGLRVVAEINC